MVITELSLIISFYIINLLQLITPTSGNFIVNALQKQVLVSLHGEAELSCQLYPPQSAEHMEIRWFQKHYTQPVHLYKDGKDINGETDSKYVERTKLLKEAIGEGKVTLRILGVRVDDDGQYHCLFQDGEFYDDAIVELKVTATNVETQMHVYPYSIKGILLECNSEGWFPQPHMEWRDDRGKIIPATSKSHSQDTDKLFNMKITLILSSPRNVTCCLRNPITGQEEITYIALPDAFFSWYSTWILLLGLILAVLMVFINKSRIKGYHRWKECSLHGSLTGGMLIFFSTILLIVVLTFILHHLNRVFASDPLSQLDAMWLEDITVVLYILLVFINMVISFVYFKIREFLSI